MTTWFAGTGGSNRAGRHHQTRLAAVRVELRRPGRSHEQLVLSKTDAISCRSVVDASFSAPTVGVSTDSAISRLSRTGSRLSGEASIEYLCALATSSRRACGCPSRRGRARIVVLGGPSPGGREQRVERRGQVRRRRLRRPARVRGSGTPSVAEPGGGRGRVWTGGHLDSEENQLLGTHLASIWGRPANFKTGAAEVPCGSSGRPATECLGPGMERRRSARRALGERARALQRERPAMARTSAPGRRYRPDAEARLREHGEAYANAGWSFRQGCSGSLAAAGVEVVLRPSIAISSSVSRQSDTKPGHTTSTRPTPWRPNSPGCDPCARPARLPKRDWNVTWYSARREARALREQMPRGEALAVVRVSRQAASGAGRRGSSSRVCWRAVPAQAPDAEGTSASRPGRSERAHGAHLAG